MVRTQKKDSYDKNLDLLDSQTERMQIAKKQQRKDLESFEILLG